MAQVGYTPLSLYYSTTGSAVPVNTNLVNGELAINIADGKLYYKDNTGTVQLLASKAGASGDVVGPASATDNAVVRFDGTTGKLVQNSAVTIADTTGDITGGAYNKVTITAPASSATLTIANGKTLTANATLTLAGTDATTMTFPSTSASIARTDAGQTFTGDQVIAGNLTMNAQGDVRFADSDSSNWVAFQGPATVASNVTWTLPNADGTSGQFLSTDGAGILSWATASGGGGGGGTSVTVTQITATASQTTFNVTYTVGQISVYLNGALLASADYTATNGTTVVLATGAAANDIFTAVVYSSVTQIIQGDTSVTVSDSGSNGTITFTTDGSERGRFNSSGYLLLGTTTSSANYGIPLLQLDNSSGPEFSLRRAATADGSTVGFMTGYSTHGLIGVMSFITDGAQTASSTPGALRFMTQASGATGSPTERARIPAAGGFQCVNSISVGNATPTTSGAGITFPATQSASSNANTLDDYEEGTWTPVVAGSTTAGTVTYSDRYGYYTKIGRFVYVWMDVTVSAFSGGVGDLEIQSVPFTSANLSSLYPIFEPWNVAAAWGQTYPTPTGFMNVNTTIMRMYTADDNHANLATMKVNQTGRIAGYWLMQTD